jgi:hypothetical protein
MKAPQYQVKPFTLADGLRVQAAQMRDWESKLNAACYAALWHHVQQDNAKLHMNSDGYNVLRGTSLDEFIFNWKA